ncbi:hypothetical protein [Methylocapsa acidiphila]|uniref:hypothetical protein n=1 Tax=Methylocapsa acidiphila TaxID=133552 RepID=UPI0004101978|nr:hypothetical protein [Methylocapsa acidiphila]
MSRSSSIAFAGALAAAFAGAAPAHAHTIVGNRVFPATLTIDDPGVNDELALPAFTYMAAANYDGTLGSLSYTFGWEYSKTITADLGISVGSGGFTWQRNPQAAGWANIETQLKYVFYQNAEHEFIISGAVNFEWGHTGSGQSSSLPSDPYTTVTPKLYIGKGFGDVGVDWAKPFAITAEADYSFSTHPITATLQQDPNTGINYIQLDQTPTVLTYGATLQYSLLYMNSYVHEVPEIFRRLIPAFEGVFSTPVSNIGPSVEGQWTHTTTGVVGPSLYYIGNYFQIGVMAQFPINQASGKHVGAAAVLDFFLDDIAPDTIGKPLFGPPQARPGRI